MANLLNAGRADVPFSGEGEPPRTDRGENVLSISLDPLAGGTFGDKPIFNVDMISENLNRTGFDWYTNNRGVLDDGVLNFGFFTQQEDFFATGYINDDFTSAFSEFFDFEAFTAEQQAAARDVIGLWDDLVAISFVETGVPEADLRFGNTDTGGAQAYAYLPFGTAFDGAVPGFSNLADLGGDIWVDKNVASNFFPLENSYYSILTLIHEAGHALGLSHPGDYDALDDNDGDGEPDPITYANDAFFAQDSLQYTVMSYFDAFETGAQHIDWTLLNFAYSATPLVHDIAAIQDIYGADTATRADDTVYGFNSTADRSAYDFDVNTRPIVTVYDAGGIDTLDFSGWDTPSVIDLNEGAFSSGGGTERFLTLDEINANRVALGFPVRTQEVFDFYITQFRDPFGLTNGLFKDNISIAYGTVIENAVGGRGNDLIIANGVANVIDGGGGSDTVSYITATSAVVVDLRVPVVFGGGEGDTLISIENVVGTAFDDIIVGDGGANTLSGGSGGFDVLIGGGGVDTVDYADADDGVVLDLQSNRTGGAARKDVIADFENAAGSAFDDTINGTATANRIEGGGSDDKIDGRNGDDVLIGGDGDDRLKGGSGDDVLSGGLGSDRLQGNSGSDTFLFTQTDTGIDLVVDFARGTDIIDLSAIDADTSTAEDDAFVFIGAGAFSGLAGELRAERGLFQLDVDGDGVADLTVDMSRTLLSESDFIL